MSRPVTAHGPAASDERRRRTYVDARLQGRLLGILLAVEAVLVLVALAAMYLRAGAVIDDNIYRVHLAGMPSLAELLLPGVVAAVAALLAVNCAAVLAIERQWARDARAIVSRFGALARRTGELDLTADEPAPYAHRAVIEMLLWREALRVRHGALRRTAAALDPDLDAGDPQAVARQRAAVAAILDALAD